MNSPTLKTENDLVALPGNGGGFLQRDWAPVFEQLGLRRIEDFLSISGNALSKPGLRMRYRAQLSFTRDGKNGFLFFKRYEGETTRSLLQRWFEDGNRAAIALREVRVADALEQTGIATFKPLAWGWQGNWGTRQKSFLVMSQVPGDSLERWLPQQKFAATSEDWKKKIRLVETVARFSKQLHESGWFHRDFYLCHIFIGETNGQFQLALVDLARMFRPRWRIQRWRTKDLAQLDFSTPQKQISRTLRLRFAKIYFGTNRLTAAQKMLLRGIARRSQKIAARELRKSRRSTGADE